MQAIKTFADARPPGIYKNDYIEALYAFYHEKRPEAVACPQTPEWKRELDLNGEAVADDDDDGVSAPHLHVCIIIRSTDITGATIIDADEYDMCVCSCP